MGRRIRKESRESSHRRREEKRADDRKEKKSERERGNRRHSIWDTREEMERGREGRDGGKGHWTVSFRDGY